MAAAAVASMAAPGEQQEVHEQPALKLPKRGLLSLPGAALR